MKNNEYTSSSEIEYNSIYNYKERIMTKRAAVKLAECHGVDPYDAMNARSQQFSGIFKKIKPHEDITECSVRMVLESGELCFLTTNQKYHADVSKRIKSLKIPFPTIHNLENFKIPGMYLLASEPYITKGMGTSIMQTLAKHDMDHAITIATHFKSQRGNAILLCTMVTHKTNQHIYRFYLNHHQEIKKFMTNLEGHLNDLIRDLEFITPTAEEVKLTKAAFLRLSSSEKQSKIILTQREKEVIYWYIKGKSADQTAKILDIASGTVRTHFERLKKKLGCYYKPQIIIELINAGLIQSKDLDNDP